MDVLSSVLRSVRLSGSVFFNARMTEPWAVASPPPELLGPVLMPGAEWFVLFHVVAEGRCCVDIPGEERVELDLGDVVIFPHGSAHVMGHPAQCLAEPTPVPDIVPPPPYNEPFELRHGGGGPRTELVCGYLRAEARFDPLLRSLPPVLCLRRESDATRIEGRGRPKTGRSERELRIEADSPTGAWLEVSLQYATHEALERSPGATSMLGRLAEVLFIQVLRAYMHQDSVGEEGWFAALRDDRVGSALALLHERPEEPWTTEDLGRQVGLSRSALRDRFRTMLGEPPMHYLASWRMHLARNLMADPSLGLAEIGARVGYTSEAAFHRAFKRHVGEPPAAWRKKHT